MMITLTFCLLFFSCLADPIRIPLTMRQMQASNITRRGASAQNVGVMGSPGIGFSVNLAFGTPAETLSVLIDTGSSNLAVASAQQQGNVQLSSWYQQSNSFTARSSSQPNFMINYASGSLDCSRVFDSVAVPGAYGAVTTEFGGVYSSSSFFQTGADYMGIWGLAYDSIAFPPNNPVTPFFDTLIAIYGISNIFTLQLCDVLNNGIPRQGSMVIGGVDSSLHHGNFQYSNIITEKFFSITITGLSVGGTRLPFSCGVYNSPSSPIVDSGSTLLYLPPVVVDEIISILMPITGYSSDFFAQTICETPTLSQLNSWPKITVSIESSVSSNYEFDLDVFPWQYMRYDGVSGCRVFSIARTCNSVILGAVLMTGYDVIFNRTGTPNTVGFASSTCGVGYSTSPPRAAIPSPHLIANLSSCLSVSPLIYGCSTTPSSNTTVIVVAVVVPIVVVLLIVIIVLLLLLRRKRLQRRKTDIEV